MPSNKYTIEFMAAEIVRYRYAESVEIVYDDGRDHVPVAHPRWTVRWGDLDVPPEDRDEEWSSVRDTTLRGALEGAYHGMYLS